MAVRIRYEPSLVLDQIRVETSGDYAATFSAHHIRCAYLPVGLSRRGAAVVVGMVTRCPRCGLGGPGAMTRCRSRPRAPRCTRSRSLAAAVCLYSMSRADPDLWGYLASGRLFVEQGGLTTHDPFAYTSTGFAVGDLRVRRPHRAVAGVSVRGPSRAHRAEVPPRRRRALFRGRRRPCHHAQPARLGAGVRAVRVHGLAVLPLPAAAVHVCVLRVVCRRPVPAIFSSGGRGSGCCRS